MPAIDEDHALDNLSDLQRWIVASPRMRALEETARLVARRRATVLISGATGCGKEMLARHIHQWSRRAEHPFIPVDCSTLSESLFESELFGHERGAFTGATHPTLGFIRAGDGGTIFLDEVGELPASVQAKLLRVLQERRVTPVGSNHSHPVDVRFVAATNRNLSAMVSEGTFREDLYFRLNVVSMEVPPLEQRREDILPLARHFIYQQSVLYDEPPCTLSPEVAQRLYAWDWPGNVRELSNLIEQLHILCSGRTIEVDDLPPCLQNDPYHVPFEADVPEVLPPTSLLNLATLERRTIVEAMRRTRYCKAKAARLLGINVQRLRRRMTRLGIPTKLVL